MLVIDSLFTASILLFFTLLGVYYFCCMLWKTLSDSSEPDDWKGHLFFAGLVIAQILGISVFVFAIYAAANAGL